MVPLTAAALAANEDAPISGALDNEYPPGWAHVNHEVSLESMSCAQSGGYRAPTGTNELIKHLGHHITKEIKRGANQTN